jgi:hypothetical protein
VRRAIRLAAAALALLATPALAQKFPQQLSRFQADEVARNAALLKFVRFQPE